MRSSALCSLRELLQLEGHLARLADHLAPLAGHPTGLADHPTGLADHPTLGSDHPTRLAVHLTRLSGEPTGESSHPLRWYFHVQKARSEAQGAINANCVRDELAADDVTTSERRQGRGQVCRVPPFPRPTHRRDSIFPLRTRSVVTHMDPFYLKAGFLASPERYSGPT